ncbi:MAG TPA: hypothetical protein VG389_27745 [Myxococcota bacterium]|jgi:hypothetical protein|nr:hypothetical protein [Myxococcota bacterium]
MGATEAATASLPGALVRAPSPDAAQALRRLALVASRALVEASAFARLLDRLPTHGDRLAAVRGCGGARAQRAIFESCAGSARAHIEDVVPRRLGALRPVNYVGKNSLAAFTNFQKRFCRPPAVDGGAAADTLWGYNHNWRPEMWVIGPGYYTAYDSDDALGGVAVDYRVLPTGKPPDLWPRVRRNDRLPPALVWDGMVDYLRRVSEHVFIGVAERHGVRTHNYFLLCRETES